MSQVLRKDVIRFKIVSLGDGTDGFLPSLLGCVVEIVSEDGEALRVRIVDNSAAAAAIPPVVGDDSWSMPRSYLHSIAVPA